MNRSFITPVTRCIDALRTVRRRSKLAIVGGTIVLVLLLTAVMAPIIAGYDPEEMDFTSFLQSPSWAHPMGTDHFGRDVLSRVIYGSRISLVVGVISVAIGLLLGVPIGLIAGYKGGALDNWLMRAMDSVLSFPEILLAIGLVSVLGPSTVSVMIAIGIVYMPGFARLVRSTVLQEREKEYVTAAIALGLSERIIIFKHILPNCLSPVIVQATVDFAIAILVEASLSFLGIGTPPPTPSWGRMLFESKEYLESSPHTAAFPGLAISVAVLGFNLLGDGLRDLLDPKLRR